MFPSLSHAPCQSVQFLSPLIDEISLGAELVQSVGVCGAGQEHDGGGEVGEGRVDGDAGQSVCGLLKAGLVRDATPGRVEGLLQHLRPAVLGEGGGGVDGAAVRDTLHINVTLHLLQLLRQVVAVELSPRRPCRGPNQDDLQSVKVM